MKQPKRGMSIPPCVTDLLFNLIGYLFLIITLANFETTKQQNEQILKDFRLSSFAELTKKKAEPINDTQVVINLVFNEKGEERINVDGKEYSLDEFKAFISSGNREDTIVALRCDERIMMGFHDKVLALCRKHGIQKIRQMVKQED